VVIEMDPEMKRRLHAVLVSEGTTLKDWFIARADEYLQYHNQPGLPGLGYPASTSGQMRMVAEEGGE
jgi:hypothetical protein